VTLHPSFNLWRFHSAASYVEDKLRLVHFDKLSLLSLLHDSFHFPRFDILVQLPPLDARLVLPNPEEVVSDPQGCPGLNRVHTQHESQIQSR
jgi:hypothetical protein